MITILSFLVLGILVGLTLRRYRLLLKSIDKSTNVAIYFLLFFLGISVGANKTIIKNIPSIGLQAITIAFGAIIGSVFLSFILYSFLYKKGSNEK